MQQSKGDHRGGGGGDDEGEREGRKRKETFSQWFEYHQNQVSSIAELLKEELNATAKRKIGKNAAIVRQEGKPGIERVGKSIVLSFNDAIFKAIRDLQASSITMAKQLQERFQLADDWMEQQQAGCSSVVTSVAGSEISGPTTSSRVKQVMDPALYKRILTFDEASRSSETSDDVRNGEAGENDKSNKEGVEGVVAAPAELDDDDVDVIPASDDDDSDETTVGEPVSSEINETIIPPATWKKEAAHQHISIKQEIIDAKSRTKSRRNKNAIDDADEHSSDSDSDASGKTCIVPSKRNKCPKKDVTPTTPRMRKIKQEPHAEKPTPESKSGGQTSGSPGPGGGRGEIPNFDFAPPSTTAPTKAESTPKVKTIKQEKITAHKMKIDAESVGEVPAEEPSERLVSEVPTSENPDEEDEDQLSQSLLDFDDTQTVILSRKVGIPPPPPATASVEIKNQSQPLAKKKISLTSEDRHASTDSSSGDVERDAMKAVLETSDSSDYSEPEKISNEEEKPKVRKQSGEERTKIISSDVSQFQDKDPKLKVDAKVSVERLAASVEKRLANQGYVILKDYHHQMKKCRRYDLLLEEIEMGDSDDDSDSSSVASDDSLAQLEKALKLLTRKSIICSMKYKRKTAGVGGSVRGRQGDSKSNLRDKESGDDDSDSADSDNSSNEPVVSASKNGRASSNRNKINDDDDDATIPKASCSKRDDVLESRAAGSDKNGKIKKKQQQSSKSRRATTDVKRKKYVSATSSSSSDSDADKKSVLDSSEGSEVEKKNKSGKSSTSKKKAKESDSSDFEEIVPRTRKTKVTRKKMTLSSSGTDEASIISLRSDDADSDVSDFKESSRKRSKRDSSPENKRKVNRKKTKKERKRRRV